MRLVYGMHASNLLIGLILLVLSIVSGCSSIGAHINYKTYTKYDYYAGTQSDIELLSELGEPCSGCFVDISSPALIIIVGVYAIIDLPFSAVLDTVLLPVDFIRAHS